MGLFSRHPFNKQKIEAAIVRLEAQTSAELRVYIERKHRPELTAFERAVEVFQALDMQKTALNNAVLIYVAYKNHQCAIVGDKGIHQYVGNDFWQQQYQLMASHFQQKQYDEGLVKAIEQMSIELAKYFPIQADDVNELDNEVIIND